MKLEAGRNGFLKHWGKEKRPGKEGGETEEKPRGRVVFAIILRKKGVRGEGERRTK